jgi:hypothetical protein
VLLDELAGLLRELLGVLTELVERLEEVVDVHGDVLSVVVAVLRPSSGRGSESNSPGTTAVPDDDQSTNRFWDGDGTPLRVAAALPGDHGTVTGGYPPGDAVWAGTGLAEKLVGGFERVVRTAGSAVRPVRSLLFCHSLTWTDTDCSTRALTRGEPPP